MKMWNFELHANVDMLMLNFNSHRLKFGITT